MRYAHKSNNKPNDEVHHQYAHNHSGTVDNGRYEETNVARRSKYVRSLEMLRRFVFWLRVWPPPIEVHFLLLFQPAREVQCFPARAPITVNRQDDHIHPLLEVLRFRANLREFFFDVLRDANRAAALAKRQPGPRALRGDVGANVHCPLPVKTSK